jgi:hypothetical protein
MNTQKSAGPSPLVVIDPQSASRDLMNRLARDVAFQIEKLETVLERMGISEQSYARLVNNPYYMRVLAAYQEEWNASANTPNRLKIQAAYLAESALPHLWARAIDRNEPFSAANEAVKTLLKVAGIGEGQQVQAIGEKFQININIGEGKEIHKEFEVKTIDATATTAPEGDYNNVNTIELIGQRNPDQNSGNG